MEENKQYTACQSCGMPIEVKEGKSEEYCQFCWKDGKFIEPDMKVEEMIERISNFLKEKMHFPAEKVDAEVKKTISGLKRWQKTKTE
jgi:hypothetical protein